MASSLTADTSWSGLSNFWMSGDCRLHIVLAPLLYVPPSLAAPRGGWLCAALHHPVCCARCLDSLEFLHCGLHCLTSRVGGRKQKPEEGSSSRSTSRREMGEQHLVQELRGGMQPAGCQLDSPNLHVGICLALPRPEWYFNPFFHDLDKHPNKAVTHVDYRNILQNNMFCHRVLSE